MKEIKMAKEVTVIVWDMMGEEPIRFAVVDGNYSDLNGIYINGEGSESQMDKLSDLQATQEFKETLSERFPYDAVKEGAKVIVCGWVP
jgi:hypothetical protein